jgi:PD-(D/E)XK nuclease superfamily
MRPSGDTPTTDLSVRMERFVDEWNAAIELTANRHANPRWKEFFDEWRKHAPQIDEARAVTAANLDSGHFAEFIAAFPVAFDEYRRSGSMLNVWRTAQLGNDEIRNCKVLATFLDHSGDHGQGVDILCSLLSTIGLQEFTERVCKRRYQTHTEVWPLNNAVSRVDIKIEGDDFLIFIEAKIAANEGDDQLQRYVDLARAKAGSRDWAVIYLTPDGRQSSNFILSDSDKVYSASWMQVSRAMRSCVAGCIDGAIRHLLLQYAEFVAGLG